MASYESAVRGCWIGKNIGGTLGAPFEGSTELHDIDFYVQKNLGGNPEPNDDLDLQLLWLVLAEFHGVYNVNQRILGDCWIDYITGPWNEYGVCRQNCISGFYPPLSGSVNNDIWKWSNGAWIRSEIWACLFPGDPDRAIKFAWFDASCDHSGEGIYAEMFTAAMESAAFVESDIRKLIQIGFSKIPVDCRVRKSIEFVCKCYDEGLDWKTTRNKVMELNKDLGWFQAPGNLSFMVIGLLYGEDDFGKTLCTAVNCGDDTDCTAATAGSILGIIHGADGIPEKWKKPIGNQIITKSFNPLPMVLRHPKTIDELTNRVVTLKEITEKAYPRDICPDLMDTTEAELLWKRSTNELRFNLSFATIGIEYMNGPLVDAGKPCQLRLWVHSASYNNAMVQFTWHLPEGWKCDYTQRTVPSGIFSNIYSDCVMTPAEEINNDMIYIPLEIRCENRNYPTVLHVPFRKNGSFKSAISEIKLYDDTMDIREMVSKRAGTMA